MPDAVQAAGAAGAAPAGGPQQQQQGTGILGTVLRMAFMWMLMAWFKGQGNTKGAVSKEPHRFSAPKFAKGDLVDMYVFLMERPVATGGRYDLAELVWSETGIGLGLKDTRKLAFTYEPSPAVQNNGSLWLHAVFARAGSSINPDDPDFVEDHVFGRAFNMVAYLPKPKNDTGVNLLSGEKQAAKPKVEDPKDEAPREIVSFLKPNLTIQLVDHFNTYPKNAIPPQVAGSMQFDGEGNYFPIIFFNEFWLLRDYLVPLNETVTNVTLSLDYGLVSMTWWQVLEQMEKTFATQRGMGLQQDGESDELKRIFLEGNPLLLAITMIVSMLHTVFDVLAFKNDIGFWRQNKSMEGLSARSVVINAFCQLVILLYLVDNETSYVVLFSSFLGTGIEFWKVTKAMKVTVGNTFPYIKLEDRASYTKTKTKQYDEEATRYLSYVLYPLVIGYSIYTLKYKTHKSWYSWILNSLVGAVYMFGFILMCPQLYLNYKLKSVAHLPWRQMTYKFLNTIIDDLFAFVIKMPLLHRLSVFRDDLIFVIYLYQRWIYRVDMKRVNEFGWAGEQDAAAEEEPAAAITDGAAGAEATGSAEGPAAGGKRKDAAAAAAAGSSAQDVAPVPAEANSKKDK